MTTYSWYECEDCRFQTNSPKYAIAHGLENDHTVEETEE